MGKLSRHTGAARRVRSLGLGWPKMLLLACSLTVTIGSVAVYTTAAVALAGQGEGADFSGFPGIVAPVGSASASHEEASVDALAQTGVGAQGPDGQSQEAQSSDAGNAPQQNAPGSSGGGGGDAAASDQASTAAFPSVASQNDKGSADKTADSSASAKGQDKKTGSSDTSQPAGSSGSSKKPASSSSNDAAAGTSSSNKPSGSTGGSSATTPSGSDSSDSTASKPSTDTTDKPSTTTPSASDTPSSGLSEATEKKIHTQLTSKYNDLAPLAEDVAEAVSIFDATVDEASASARKSALSKAKALYTKASDASAAMQSLSVPAKSQYRANYDDMLILYDDLATAADVLRRAWGVACGSVDVSGKTEPRQVVAAYSDSNGKLNALKDYEKRYPGARP
ncbi:MAG: hypothetical protein UCH28_09075 [Adlercreutzia sp.]|nr:hypothetical protein [Adlercreutzia sp.]